MPGLGAHWATAGRQQRVPRRASVVTLSQKGNTPGGVNPDGTAKPIGVSAASLYTGHLAVIQTTQTSYG